MLRKLKYLKKNNQLSRNYTFEELQKIINRNRKRYTVFASCFALLVIFYLAYAGLSLKMEAHKQTRLLAERLMDLQIKSIELRSSSSIFLSSEGDWLVQNNSTKTPCEKTESKKLQLFFKKPKNLTWKAFLMKKNENTTDSRKRIDSFCIDAIKGIVVNDKVLQDPYFISIFSYMKNQDNGHLENIKEIAIQKNGTEILLRDFL